MKLAASPQHRSSAQETKPGGARRKPFFSAEHPSSYEMQARLRVGRPGDRYEVEADRVADRVVAGAAASVSGRGLAAGITPLTQRLEKKDEAEGSRSEPEEEVEELQAKADEGAQSEEEKDDQLQARAMGAGVSATAEVARQVRAAHGDGNPLPGSVRERMEAQFGADFSAVRIHTDTPAARLSQAVKAHAFTRGGDIFFNEGTFAPDSRTGEHLLAHELTHTIQQGAVVEAEQSGANVIDQIPTVEERGADARKTRPDVPPNRAGIVSVLESVKDEEGKPAETRLGRVSPPEEALDGAPRVEPAQTEEKLDRVEPAPEATQETAEAGQSAELADVETEVEPPPPEVFGEALPEPDLTLPPQREVGPAEQVAEIAAVDLTGSSHEATTRFIDATPSAMAATQPALGPAVDGAMKAEQRALATNPPVLALKTSGMVDAPIASATDIPIPGDVQIVDAMAGPDPGTIASVSEATPQPFRGNAQREPELEQEDSGSFWDAFMNFIRGFVSGIRTRDDSIDTTAGDCPNVKLKGEADATRMHKGRQESTDAIKAQRDTHTEAFRNHPGQSRIQPQQIDEERHATVSGEPVVTIEPQVDVSVADYAAAPLPQDVRDAADAKVATTLTPNLAEARTQAVEAAATRDTAKARETDTAQQAAAELNTETDTAQRRLVVENRTQVARLQGEGVAEAHAHVNTFTKDAAAREVTDRKEIGDHVKTEEDAARKALDKGEEDAEAEKKKGEAEAAAKKIELEKAKEKESWWDRVKSAIKSAVRFITDQIDKVFTRVRNAVKGFIEKAKNAAIGLINAARDWVVDKLNKFRDWAKSMVDKYLKDTFPGLAKRINAGIDAVANTAIKSVNYVADKAIAGVTALADKLTKALDKILSTFQIALKTAVRVVGAVMQGDFAEALRAVIEGACEIVGVDPKPVFEFLDRAGKAIASILRDPVKFIKGLFSSVGDGIVNFFKNIKKHLIEGVIGWLTGALSEVNLTGPFEFSPKGILSIVLQILGLTYANLKARVIKRLPAAAKVFDRVEKGYALLKRLVDEGPGALWEEIKGQLTNLKETVMGAIRNWLITTVIKEGIIWLLSLTNPASAIVKAIKLVFDLIMFLVERYQQIKDFVLSVYESVAAIASGNFTKATLAVEHALARILPVLISLLATLAGLGGIAKQVKKVIEAVTKPINRAIDWVVNKIVAFAKKILRQVKVGARKVKETAKAAAAKIRHWWTARSGFNDASGASHTLSYKGEKRTAKLYVASSNPTHVPAFLQDRKQLAKAGGQKYTVTDVQGAENYHTHKVAPAEKKLQMADTGSAAAKRAKSEDANRVLVDDLQKHLDHLGKKWLSRFFDPGDATDCPPPKLPVMADNTKASSFEADYIVAGTKKNKYKYKVKTGSESGRHVGNLGGWSELQGAKLTTGSKYVRMHLLPHKLGGDAVDSNLTPARGDLFNTPFSKAIEQPAIQASTEGVDANRKPIWYRFEISHYPAGTSAPAAWTPGVPYPAEAFPNLIHAEWGFYTKPAANAPMLKRDTAVATKTDKPSRPDLAVTPPAINRDGVSALLHALRKQDKTISSYFVSEILIGNRKYPSKTAMKETTWLKFGGEREATRRRYVQAAYDAVGTHVTLD